MAIGDRDVQFSVVTLPSGVERYVMSDEFSGTWVEINTLTHQKFIIDAMNAYAKTEKGREYLDFPRIKAMG